MKRMAGVLVLVVAVNGCMTTSSGPDYPGSMSQGRPPTCANGGPPMNPAVVGPWGQSMPVAGPYAVPPGPNSTRFAQGLMMNSVPLDQVQMTNPGILQASAQFPGQPGAGPPQMPMPPRGLLAPPGMPPLPGMMPPGGGPMPGGMGGPGMPMMGPPGMPGMMPSPPMNPPGGVAALGAMPGKLPYKSPNSRTQVRIVQPSGMRVSWFSAGPDGKPSFSTTPIEAPGRYNFLQGAIYRLKLSNIEGRPGLELYPTLEVVPANPKTEAFLSHNAVPIDFTPEDFKQVAEGNYLVKVIYLPDPNYQELAATGIDQIISTRLEPGADPIKEALRRGSILLVIRMGNLDQEAPNTPALDAPGPGGPPPMPGPMPGPGMPPMMGPPGMPMMGPGMPPQRMVPFGPMGPMGGPNGMMPPPNGMMPPPNGMMPPNGGQQMMPPNMPPGGPMGPRSQAPGSGSLQQVGVNGTPAAVPTPAALAGQPWSSCPPGTACQK